MFLGVLAGHAQSCRVISWISCLPSASVSGHTTQNTTSTRSLPAPRKQFQPCAALAVTSTDCDVHDHVVPDIQPECGSCLTRRIYFAFARQCKYEHGQKPNHQHHALEAAMSCDEGLKIKQHTSCVATPHRSPSCVSKETTACRRTRGNNRHIWKRNRPQPKCGNPKTQIFPRQMAKTPLCNPALTKLTMIFGGVPEQILAIWSTFASNRDSI